MTDVPPPPSATPPPPPPAATPPPGAPPPKQGLSTGVKIAIGCGALLVLVLILLFACFGFAAKKVGEKVDDLETSMERQEEAGRTAEELEREHPFTSPADGVLDDELVDRFFRVTDDTWDEIEDWASDIARRGERIEEEGGEAGFGDAMAGMRGMGQARVALVEALEEHDMAPSAYVWTGFKLLQAHEAASGGSAGGVPQRNLEIARDHADALAELEEEDGDEAPDRGSVLALAYVFFPSTDVLVPPGMDTMP